MPSSYLHEYMAQSARALYPLAWQPQHACYALMGAQGPDLLFGYKLFTPSMFMKPCPQGGMMHTTHTGAFLIALAKRAAIAQEEVKAFTAGFFTHYAADTALHPYVYAHSMGETAAIRSLRHLSLEKNFDAWLYQAQGHSGSPRLYSTLKASRSAWPLIAGAWHTAMAEVYRADALSADQLLRAFRDMLLISNLTYSPRGVKYNLIQGVEKLCHVPGMATAHMVPVYPLPILPDEVNLARQPWHNPYAPETVRTDSVPDLMDASIRRAEQLLKALTDYWADNNTLDTLIHLTGNDSYTTGLPCTACGGT